MSILQQFLTSFDNSQTFVASYSLTSCINLFHLKYIQLLKPNRLNLKKSPIFNLHLKFKKRNNMHVKLESSIPSKHIYNIFIKFMSQTIDVKRSLRTSCQKLFTVILKKIYKTLWKNNSLVSGVVYYTLSIPLILQKKEKEKKIGDFFIAADKACAYAATTRRDVRSKNCFPSPTWLVKPHW